ncbi:MAG: 4-hydroxythreonine-4-phosphate dehydrogenase PdxA, partial [Proteobacteria bacterium]|nr:4-hydroxythreonine-4-phosphate dehydrogenase PdxA [Pseudomonadota bacterium]
MTAAPRTPLAVTMGEPAGVGGDLILAAWASRRRRRLPPFVVLDDPARLRALAATLGLDIAVREVAAAAEAGSHFDSALPVLPVALAAPVTPGRPDARNAPAVIESIDRAVDLALSGDVGGIVTAPVHKATLYKAGFRAPGHTEYLAERAGAPGAVMMLACPQLRTVPVTVHVSLREAIRTLSTAAIVATGKILAAALAADFGLARPRIAVAGLNPHAGEDGAMGDEEIRIIAPAVAALAAAGIDVTGPHAPDGMFHAHARDTYDAALCMTHDQALIPLKAIGFDEGINVTLGLPFVRTSPDHGTAFALAATGHANPGSTVAALTACGEIAARRRAAPAR